MEDIICFHFILTAIDFFEFFIIGDGKRCWEPSGSQGCCLGCVILFKNFTNFSLEIFEELALLVNVIIMNNTRSTGIKKQGEYFLLVCTSSLLDIHGLK